MIPYKYEPFTDFTVEKNHQEFKAALKLVEAELGNDYGHYTLPPMPSFLPSFAKKFTTHRQCIYQ